MANASIGGDADLEARLFGCLQERTVAERVPASGLRGVTRVPRQQADQALRRPVVKEDERRERVRLAGSRRRNPVQR